METSTTLNSHRWNCGVIFRIWLFCEDDKLTSGLFTTTVYPNIFWEFLQSIAQNVFILKNFYIFLIFWCFGVFFFFAFTVGCSKRSYFYGFLLLHFVKLKSCKFSTTFTLTFLLLFVVTVDCSIRSA